MGNFRKTTLIKTDINKKQGSTWTRTAQSLFSANKKAKHQMTSSATCQFLQRKEEGFTRVIEGGE